MAIAAASAYMWHAEKSTRCKARPHLHPAVWQITCYYPATWTSETSQQSHTVVCHDNVHQGQSAGHPEEHAACLQP